VSRFGTLIAVLALFSSVAFAQDLRAGAAKNVITPDLHGHTFYLAGFGHDRVAEGVHDDLYVRCLALADKSTMLVLCSADLIGLFYEDVQKIRSLFAAQAPAHSWLIVACTHVHSGPDTLGLWGPSATKSGVNTDYLDWVEHQIADTAAEAVRQVRPARLAFGRDDHPLLQQLQSVDRPPFVHDPFLFALRAIDTRTGSPIATLVNWSDHPEVFGRPNKQISADYPHALCDYIERHVGGMALFFNAVVGKVSALGNDVAIQDPETGALAPEPSWRKAELLGTLLGKLVERSLKRPQTLYVDHLSIAHAAVFVPIANERFRLAIAAGVFDNRRPLYTNGKLDPSTATRNLPGVGDVAFPLGHDIQTEVDYVQLLSGGRAVAEIATIPAEIYPELVDAGIARLPGADYPDAPFEPTLRERFHTNYQFVFGVANDELGYVIPKAEWDAVPPWLQNKPSSWYGEINSLGPDGAAAILNAVTRLMTPTKSAR
jgi:hypothetical protein